ncbi:hypothetical protein N9250_00885 [bacterium]|nr:hypothetical protein [bacterium]
MLCQFSSFGDQYFDFHDVISLTVFMDGDDFTERDVKPQNMASFCVLIIMNVEAASGTPHHFYNACFGRDYW